MERAGYPGLSAGRDVTGFSEIHCFPAAIVKGGRAAVCPT